MDLLLNSRPPPMHPFKGIPLLNSGEELAAARTISSSSERQFGMRFGSLGLRRSEETTHLSRQNADAFGIPKAPAIWTTPHG